MFPPASHCPGLESEAGRCGLVSGRVTRSRDAAAIRSLMVHILAGTTDLPMLSSCQHSLALTMLAPARSGGPADGAPHCDHAI